MAFSRPPLFRAQIEGLLAGIAIDPVRLQGMRGIQRMLDERPAVTGLALRNVAFCEFE